MIGNKLKELRTLKGYTLSQLCDKIGMNQNTYAKYERNERDVSTETLSKLADFYGVTTDYLLGREPQPDPFADLDLTPEREKDVLDKYMSFPPEVRACLLDVLRKLGAAADGKSIEPEKLIPDEIAQEIDEEIVQTLIKGEQMLAKKSPSKK